MRNHLLTTLFLAGAIATASAATANVEMLSVSSSRGVTVVITCMGGVQYAIVSPNKDGSAVAVTMLVDAKGKPLLCGK